MATTYNNLYLDTRARLRKAGIDAAQLEARELLCYASDKSREQLYRDMSLYVSAELERRVEELDLCAGSGCVGLAVAANVPACRVVLGELSEGALRVCKQNVRRNSLNARVTCVSVNALEPPASALWDFDIIACNPPYIPTGDIPGLDVSVRDYEPHMALDGGADGLDFYRAVTQKWKSALRLGGSLIFEVGIGQAPSVEDILARNGFEGIQTTADTQGIWRVVEGTVNR